MFGWGEDRSVEIKIVVQHPSGEKTDKAAKSTVQALCTVDFVLRTRGCPPKPMNISIPSKARAVSKEPMLKGAPHLYEMVYERFCDKKRNEFKRIAKLRRTLTTKHCY